MTGEEAAPFPDTECAHVSCFHTQKGLKTVLEALAYCWDSDMVPAETLEAVLIKLHTLKERK